MGIVPPPLGNQHQRLSSPTLAPLHQQRHVQPPQQGFASPIPAPLHQQPHAQSTAIKGPQYPETEYVPP